MTVFGQSRDFLPSEGVYTSSIGDLMTPTERRIMEAQMAGELSPSAELGKSFGGFGAGVISSFTGYAGARAGLSIFGTEHQRAYETPLNFENRTEYPEELPPNTNLLEIGDEAAWRKNNIEGLTDDLLSVPTEDWPWVLEADNYGDFRDRLTAVQMAQPDFAAQGDFSGKALGFAADTSAIILMSLALEPLAFMGSQSLFTTGGRQVATALGEARWGTMRVLAEEAATAAKGFSRMQGAVRYAGLGLAEETAIKIAKYGIDPTYRPEFSSLVTDGILAAGIGGAIGGWAGRVYVQGQIERHARMAIHEMRLGGGHVGLHQNTLSFASNAAADRKLLTPTSAPLEDSLDDLADQAWDIYSVSGEEFIPGTRQVLGTPVQPSGATATADDVAFELLGGWAPLEGSAANRFDNIINRERGAANKLSKEYGEIEKELKSAKQLLDDLRAGRTGRILDLTDSPPNAFEIAAADAKVRELTEKLNRVGAEETQAYARMERATDARTAARRSNPTPDRLVPVRQFSPTVWTTANANLLRTVLNQTEVGSAVPFAPLRRILRRGDATLAPEVQRAQRYAGKGEGFDPNKIVLSAQPTGGRGRQANLGQAFEDARVAREGGQGTGSGIELEFDSASINGKFFGDRIDEMRAYNGQMFFNYNGNFKNLNKSLNRITVHSWADPAEVAKVDDMLLGKGWSKSRRRDGSFVYSRRGTRRPFGAKTGNQASVTGVQSTVLNIVAEIQRRGGTVTKDTARAITRMLFALHKEGVRGVAFEAEVWKRVAGMVDEKTAKTLEIGRKTGNLPQIRKLDQMFDDAVERSEYLDGLMAHFEDFATPGGLGEDVGDSLILQVMDEIRTRGGEVNRDMLDDLVEELRDLVVNPPLRKNAKGRMTLDSRARKASLAELINRRVPQNGRKISIPRRLEKFASEHIEFLSKARNAAKAARNSSTSVAPASPVPATATAAGSGAAGTAGGAGGGGGGAAGGAGSSAAGVVQMSQEVARATKWDAAGPFKAFFNQAKVVLQSPNPAARLVGFLSFNSRLALTTETGKLVTQGHTIFEQGSYEMAGFMGRYMKAWRNGFVRSQLNASPGSKIGLRDQMKVAFGSGRKQAMAEYDRAVLETISSGTPHANQHVNDAAKEIQNVLREMHQVAADAGVRGFQNSAIVNYFPRKWNWQKLARLGTTPEGRRALENFLVQFLGGTTGARTIMMPDGSMQALTDVPSAAKVLANRLINLANDSELAPLLDNERAVADEIEKLLGPISPTGTSRTPHGRPRIIGIENARITLTQDLLNSGKMEIAYTDLIETDVNRVLKDYLTSVMGAVNEARLIKAFNQQMTHFDILDAAGKHVEVETVEEIFSVVNKLGIEFAHGGGKMDDGVEGSLREIIAALRYEPMRKSNKELRGIGRFLDNVSNIMLPLGYMSTGGAFGLAALTEMSRVVGSLGLASTVRQMPVLAEMLNNWRNMDSGVGNFASLIDQAFHPSTDRLRRALYYSADNGLNMGDNLGGINRTLQSATNSFSDITLLAPVTSFTQHLAGASLLQHLYDVGKAGVKRMDDVTIRTLGLEPQQYDNLVQFMGKNAVLDGKRVVNLNNLAATEMDDLRVMIDRFVRTRIQDVPTRGDFSSVAFTWWGRLLTQFRTFNLKGIDNFMFQNRSRLARGDANTRLRVAQEIGATMLFAGLIQYGRNYAQYESAKSNRQYTKAKEIKERFLGVDGFVRGAFTGPSEFYAPMFAIDSAWTSFVSDDPLFSAYRYSGLGLYGIPSVSMLGKASGIAKDVYGATVAPSLGLGDKTRNITQQTIHKARMLMPGNNIPVFKELYNLGEAEIAREFRLQANQPRQ